MNKTKFFSSLLVGALFATTSVFTSCKDYDDDINGLKSQIETIQKSIDDINAKIANGSVITAVNPLTDGTGGIEIVLSNGQKYNITNGKDGISADVWTIDADGYWCKNGVRQDYKAVGEKGDPGLNAYEVAVKNGYNGTLEAWLESLKGANGLSAYELAVKGGYKGTEEEWIASLGGVSGPYYVPNEETGCFDLYNGDGTLKQHTTISYKAEAPGAITATFANGVLTLEGVEGAEGGKIVIASNNGLRGLVFIGDMTDDKGEVNRRYVDAIPAIIIDQFSYKEQKLENKDGKEKEYSKFDKTEAINPETFAYYHVNPVSASVDELKSLVYSIKPNGQYIWSGTRSNASNDFDVKPTFVEFKDGILKVKVEVTGSPATGDKISTVALQAFKDNKDTITSDYATIFKQDLKAVRLAKPVRDKDGKYTAKVDYDYRRAVITDGIVGEDPDAGVGEELWNNPTTPYTVNKKKVYDIDYANNNKNVNESKDIDLYLNYLETFDLNDSVEVHTVGDPHGTMTLAEAESKLGLKVQYEVVKFYEIGSEKTNQADFITLDGSKVSSRVFNDTKKTAAINRTPIIRATLYDSNHGNKFVEIAYIKIKWVAEKAKPIDQDQTLPMNAFSWDCAGKTIKTTVEQINVHLYNQFGYDSKTFHNTFKYMTPYDQTSTTKPYNATYANNIGSVVQEEALTATGETTYDLVWTITAEQMWAHGNGDVEHTIIYSTGPVDGEGNPTGTKIAVKLTSTLSGISKEVNVLTPDYIKNYWSTGYGYARFNAATAWSIDDTDKNHCIFVNDPNSLFTTNDKGILSTSETSSLSEISYFFCEKDLDGKEFVIGKHKVKYSVEAGGLHLLASVDGGPAELIAVIDNNLAGIPHNTVTLLETSDNAKILLNDQDADKTPFFAYYRATGKICTGAFEIDIKFNSQDHFEAHWIRPVNIEEKPADYYQDGADFQERHSYLKLEDLINPYDWRNRYFKDYTNYWKFYGVESISVDLATIKTDLGGTKKALPATITVAVFDKNGYIVPGEYVGNIDKLTQPAKFYEGKMGSKEVTSDFGFLVYMNNLSETNEDFHLYLYATLEYKWGKVTSNEITVDVKRTKALE